MNFIRIIAGLSLFLICLVANATPLKIIDESGKLIGAKGVEFDGSLYDVTLIYGKTYDQVYRQINRDPIRFQSPEVAYFATIAFVSQVVVGYPLEVPSAWWDTEGPEFELLGNSFSFNMKTYNWADAYSINNPYNPTIQGGWVTYITARIRGGSMKIDPSGNELIYQKGLLPSEAVAVWSNKRSTVTEPISLLLLLAGFVAIAASRLKYY